MVGLDLEIHITDKTFFYQISSRESRISNREQLLVKMETWSNQT